MLKTKSDGQHEHSFQAKHAQMHFDLRKKLLLFRTGTEERLVTCYLFADATWLDIN